MTTLTTAQTTEMKTVETEETELERIKRIMMDAARRNRHGFNMSPFPAFDRAAHWAHEKFARGLSEEDYRQLRLYIQEVERDLGQRTVEDFDELAQTVPSDRRESYCLWVLWVTAGYESDERQRVLDWLKIKLARLFGGNAAADEWIQRHTAPTTPRKPNPKKQPEHHTGHRAKDPQADNGDRTPQANRQCKIRPKGQKPAGAAETPVQGTAPVILADDGYQPSEAEVRARAEEIQQSNADVFEVVDDALLATARDQLIREHYKAVTADQQPETATETPTLKNAKRSRNRRHSESPAAEAPTAAATA